MSLNAQLAAKFDLMSDVLQLIDANRFKVAAYQRASRALGDLSADVAGIAEDGGVKALTAIDGIGKGLAEKIVEFIETEKIAEIDAALSEVPAGVIAMLDIPGLGPKKVKLLWDDGGIESIAALKTALEGDALAELPGMGKKTLDNLRKSIAFAESSGGRVRIADAMRVAERVVEAMRGAPGVTATDYAGSLRRGKETIGDVDILVACDSPDDEAAAIGEHFRGLDCVAEVLAAGATKSSVRTEDGLQIDLRVIDTERYGAALLYFTGSKEHNVKLRERAIKQKLTLNEYGLWKQGDDTTDAAGKPVAAKTEADIYKKLTLVWIAPPLREDRGEIDLAADDALPKLIELADIQAELHAHTTASDGHWSILELAEAVRERGMHTIAVTDHSRSSAIANGLDNDRLVKHIAAIHEANERVEGITILAGSEVDILADGTLDYPDELLAQLDIVVASPHAALGQDPKKATARLLAAIQNPHVHILGHPTGRIINRREGLSPDMPALFAAAAEHDVAMEINANHYRLDLRDTHARTAIEAGCKLAIDTDAHGPGDLDELRYGILTAQRAGATKADVINCMTAAKLHKWLHSKR